MGIANACLYTVSRLLAWATGGSVRIVKYYFMAQPIAGQPMPMRPSRAFDLRCINEESVFLSQIDRPPGVFASRFAQGARCVAALASGDELAGFLWFVKGPFDEDEVRVRFYPEPQPTAAWDFDLWVKPQYRMGRLFGYLWSAASAEMARAGITHTVSRISAFNPGSLTSHARMGGQTVGQATFFCTGRWELMKSSLSPKWHFSGSEAGRPELRVSAILAKSPES